MIHWLIYALGGGLGHLTRAVALARAARRRAIACTVLTNSPWAWLVEGRSDLLGDTVLRTISPEADRGAVAAAVHAALDEVPFDRLVVDTFPRGLAGELADRLPDVGPPKCLVHRDLSPEYVERFALREFVAVYDDVICPGEAAPLSDLARTTAPWLVVDEGEVLEPVAARRELTGPEDDGPLVLVLATGRPEEVEEMRVLGAGLADRLDDALVRTLGPADGIWPLLPLLRGVDVLVGAGGYHTVNEARATGTPLLAIPRERMYDRQARRLRAGERAVIGDLLARIRERLAEGRGPWIPYVNGASAAVDFLS